MTPNEAFQEAMAKAYELLEEKKQEEDKAVAARAAYNLLVNEVDFESVEGEAEAALAAKREELAQILEDDLNKAKKPLEAAQKKYEQAATAAQSKFDASLKQFEKEQNERLNSLRMEHTTRLAAAEMEVHAAKQRVTELENTYNRHCDTFKAQKGPDIKNIIASMRE